MADGVPRTPLGSWSIAARLTLWYTASAFSLVLIATAVLYWVLVRNLQDEDGRLLADKVHVLRTLLRERGGSPSALKEVEWEWAARQYQQIYVRVLDEAGRAVVETPGMAERLPTQTMPDDRASPVGVVAIRTADGQDFRAMSATVAGADGRMYEIQVAVDLAPEQLLLATYRMRLWLVLGSALLASGIIGHAIGRRGVRPLEKIGRTAREVRATTLNARIDLDRLPAEVASLAGTFNEMLDRLEESFDRLSRFSADLAHELRTPVQNLRGEIEMSLARARSPEEYQEAQASCLEECNRLTRIIDSLLFLARAEQPDMRIRREPIDVRTELEIVRDFYEASAADHGVALTVDAPAELGTAVDRTLFQRALSNLVANALAHTQSGGTVTLHAAHEGGGIRVEVIDSGEGVAPEDLPRVFDRFYRGDKSRSGASGRVGLGLAIVRSIAQLHGGTVEIVSQIGRGTRATLVLPRMTPDTFPLAEPFSA